MSLKGMLKGILKDREYKKVLLNGDTKLKKAETTTATIEEISAKVEAAGYQVYEIQNHIDGNYVIYGDPGLREELSVVRDDSLFKAAALGK